MVLNEAQTCRVPTPCDPAELRPLLAFLEEGNVPVVATAFPRGTLMPDGRLDLCKQDLGPQNLEAITTALSANTFVKSLLLGADFIGDRGAAHLGKLLDHNTTLETLFLGCNGITEAGVARICEGAERHPSLQGLWLKRNQLDERGARHVARLVRQSKTIRSLDLVDTRLGSAGMALVVRGLIEDNRVLERLYLCANGLDAKDAGVVAELLRSDCPIRELYISTNSIGDEGCRLLAGAIERTARIRVLGLSSNGISEVGAAYLGDLLGGSARLEVLELGQSASMKIHRAPPNHVGDRGAIALSARLGRDRDLQRLLLGGNGIGALGGLSFVHALEGNTTLTKIELGRHVPRSIKRDVAQLLRRNIDTTTPPRVPPEIEAIQSVYRVPRGGRGLPLASPKAKLGSAPPAVTTPPICDPAALDGVDMPLDPSVSAEDLGTCLRVLDELRRHPEPFFRKDSPYRDVRAAANRLIAALIAAAPQRKQVKQRKGERARTAPSADRGTERVRPPAPGARACYVCKQRYAESHAFYEALCPSCGTKNLERRQQSADLTGQVVLVTGGRIKIGHEVALKLLRAGCRVLATTRFPVDAARRFASNPDFEQFQDRLTIIPVDLRDLRSASQLAAWVHRETGRLDVLVNNAAMTIHRPPAYYADLIAKENDALDARLARLLSPLTSNALATTDARRPARLPSSVDLAEVTLVPKDPAAWSASMFPAGVRDVEGQPLDLRPANSWSSTFEEVSTGELLEVHLVSTFAPFVLTRDLVPLMRATPAKVRHIVNVSAMEGSFSRTYKTAGHPHTNMAKSALNMLTRTLGESLAKEGILINSVDTGWIADEQPHVIRERRRNEKNFQPPLDVVDGAARVCDPIFRAARGDYVGFGQFLKDYRAVGW